MTIGQRIKQERAKNKLLQEDVARFIGSTKQAVYKYENEIVTNIPTDKISKMAQLFNVTPAYLMGWNDHEQNTQITARRIPVIGTSAAGIPIDAVQQYIDDNDPDTWEEITESMAQSGSYVAVKIKGDSMEPRIFDGDIVIVKVQDHAENGDTIIVLVNGDEATCKKIKKTPEGVMLIPNNPAYEPMFYTCKEVEQLPVRVYGKVVEVRGKL